MFEVVSKSRNTVKIFSFCIKNIYFKLSKFELIFIGKFFIFAFLLHVAWTVAFLGTTGFIEIYYLNKMKQKAQ